jgi:hypothetical protein
VFQEVVSCVEVDHWRVETGFVQAEAYHQMGLLALATGNPASAEKWIAYALYMHQKNEMNHNRDPKRSRFVALCLNDLGRLRIQMNDLESALFTLQRAHCSVLLIFGNSLSIVILCNLQVCSIPLDGSTFNGGT